MSLYSKANAFIRGVFLLLVTLQVSSCAGRNLRPGLVQNPEILRRKWAIQLYNPNEAGVRSAGFSSILLSENALIYGNHQKGLVSHYVDINRVRWVLPIESGVDSGITVSDGLIYFGAMDGYLYCVDFETGQVKWRYEVRNAKLSRPTIFEGRVFVTASDDSLYALDAKTGKWLWHYRRRPSGLPTIHGVSAPLIDKGEVLAGLSDGYLIGLQLDNGQLKWERKLHDGRKFTDIDGDLYLENGILYVPAYDGSLYAIQRSSLQTLWKNDFGGSRSVLVDGTNLLIPSSQGVVISVQKNNGKKNWEFELDKGTPTEVIKAGDYYVFASSYQYIYVVDRLSGKLVDRFNVGWDSGFGAALVFEEKTNTIYALSSVGNVYSFTLKQPKKIAAK